MNRCWCSKELVKSLVGIEICPVHKLETTKEPKPEKPKRSKIGKYSGFSKRFKGAYERK